jgi:hypothetical protein
MPLDLTGNVVTSLGVKLLNNTSFITTNLKYLWDAGMSISYPGSGTSWYEFTDSTARTGTLTNGPVFSNLGGGSIYFDGGNDQVRFSTFDLGGPPWTVSFWIKTVSDGGLFSHFSGGPVYNAFEIQSGKLTYRYYNNSGWNQSPPSSTSVNTNVWLYVSFVASSATGTFTYYLNGVADGTFTPVSNGVGSGNMGVLGSTWDGGGQWNGFMAQCSIHSTNLSASQILQNYNAQRQRFGV